MLTLLWQVFVLLGCCLVAGSSLLFLIPRDYSLLSKVLFSTTGGIFLAVLIPQSLIYLGVPVWISAWLLFGVASFQLCRRGRQLGNLLRSVRSNADLRALLVVVLLTVTFHSLVPAQQGIDSFYGNAGTDQINYVFLAEFLKDEPYKTDFQDIGLRPWLLMGLNLKHQRIGQSVITAEISVLSLTNTKSAYAATFIFFLTALAMCFYSLLREIEISHFTSGLGGFLPAIFPGITHVFLHGFLSQTAALFVFAFFATLLHRRDLNGRSFTVFFSLGLAYLISVYSEMAPLGLCCFFLGVVFVRRNGVRQKLLILLCGSVLGALCNPFFICDLTGFLFQQYSLTLRERSIDQLLPNFLTLRGWSAMLFGAADPSWVLPAEFCGVVYAVIALTGYVLLSNFEKLVFGSVLLPVAVLIAYLSTRVPLPVYPITKLMFSFSPFAGLFALVATHRLWSQNRSRIIQLSRASTPAVLVVAAAVGSINEYRLEVINSSGSELFREPDFLNVCRRLELMKNRKMLLFDMNRYILGWLCYHARNNKVYCDARAIGTVETLRPFPFSIVPNLDSLDLIISRDRIFDPKAANTMCGTLIESFQEPDYENGKARYWLGQPAYVRVLALHAISANITMRLEPGPDAKTLPIHFSLSNDYVTVAQGSFSDETVEVKRLDLPRGFSDFKLIVSAEGVEARAAGLPLHIAKLDEFKVGDIKLTPAK